MTNGKLVSINSPKPLNGGKTSYLQAAHQLLRCFPARDGIDIEALITAIVAVMMHYPIDIAQAVADPYYGLPGQQNFMPTPFEVRKACDARYLPRVQQAEHDRRIAQQFADRDQHTQAQLRHVSTNWWDQQREEMIARGFRPDEWLNEMRITGETSATVMRKLGITSSQFDALPPTNALSWKPIGSVMISSDLAM